MNLTKMFVENRLIDDDVDLNTTNSSGVDLNTITIGDNMHYTTAVKFFDTRTIVTILYSYGEIRRMMEEGEDLEDSFKSCRCFEDCVGGVEAKIMPIYEYPLMLLLLEDAGYHHHGTTKQYFMRNGPYYIPLCFEFVVSKVHKMISL